MLRPFGEYRRSVAFVPLTAWRRLNIKPQQKSTKKHNKFTGASRPYSHLLGATTVGLLFVQTFIKQTDLENSIMTAISNDAPCPCDSGLNYGECCNNQERTETNIVATVSRQGISTTEPLTPQLQAALDNIHTAPAFFPARVNFAENAAYFIKLSPRWYQQSVFMDPARIIGSCVIQTDLPWLADACDKITRQRSAYIFHTAFCGSTLMSQALDAAYQTLPIREPELLGNLLTYLRNPNNTDKDKEAWYRRIMALLSRRFDAQHMAVVKANDNANPVMIAMIERKTNSPMLFMYTPLREFLTGCLKADNRKQWIAQRVTFLRAPIAQLLGLAPDFPVAKDAYGELAALYWSYNIALFHKAYRAAPESVCSLKFTQMLKDPVDAVKRCGEWFGLLAVDDINFEEALKPLLGVYSKNNQFRYSAGQREKDIAKLLDANPEELASAEELAHKLLKEDYPELDLPGNLLG